MRWRRRPAVPGDHARVRHRRRQLPPAAPRRRHPRDARADRPVSAASHRRRPELPPRQALRVGQPPPRPRRGADHHPPRVRDRRLRVLPAADGLQSLVEVFDGTVGFLAAGGDRLGQRGVRAQRPRLGRPGNQSGPAGARSSTLAYERYRPARGRRAPRHGRATAAHRCNTKISASFDRPERPSNASHANANSHRRAPGFLLLLVARAHGGWACWPGCRLQGWRVGVRDR